MTNLTQELPQWGTYTVTLSDGYTKHFKKPRLHDVSDYQASVNLDEVAIDLRKDPELADSADLLVAAAGYAREYHRHGMEDYVSEALELGHLAHAAELRVA